MVLDKETVKYVSHLARIDLKDNELEKLSLQLKDILDFIDKLTALDVKNIKPTSHILPLSNVLRPDVPHQSLPTEKTLSCAPEKEGTYFVVPKVIE